MESWAQGLRLPQLGLPGRTGSSLAPLDLSPHDHLQPQTKDGLVPGVTLTPVSSLYPKSLFF